MERSTKEQACLLMVLIRLVQRQRRRPGPQDAAVDDHWLLMVVRGISRARLNSGRGFPPGVLVVILGIVWWLPVLVVAALAAWWLWGRHRTRQRGAAVARFASQHGMSYSAIGYVDSPGYDFPLRAGTETPSPAA